MLVSGLGQECPGFLEATAAECSTQPAGEAEELFPRFSAEWRLDVAEPLPADVYWSQGAMRVAAIQGKPEQALSLLGKTIAAGVASWHWVSGTSGHDFESLRNDGRFRRLMGGMIRP